MVTHFAWVELGSVLKLKTQLTSFGSDIGIESVRKGTLKTVRF